MQRYLWLSIQFFCLVAVPLTAHAETIHDIQYTTNPIGSSPYNGQIVTLSGIVTSIDYDGYVIAEAAGPWQAVYVYSWFEGPHIGDEIEITGMVVESSGMTVITSITAFVHLSSGNFIEPVVLSAADVSEEMFESVLITVNDLDVSSLRDYGEWVAEDDTGEIICDDRNDYFYFPQVGDALTSLTGVLAYTFGDFKLEPRFTLDIAGDIIPHFTLAGDVVTMNASLDVLENAYIEVLGDRILGVTSSPVFGVPVFETDGLIFPGLIDPHNHGIYNVLDHIPFGQTFQDRYEWQATQTYANFNTQYYGIRNYGGTSAQRGNLSRLFETRALSAGTTTMQSANCNGDENAFYAHQGIIVNNAERYPSRIYDHTFPLNETQAAWQAAQDEYWDRFVVHIAEGINAAALAEFHTWQAWGMLDWRTTIVHGVALGTPEWEAMAAADAHLVWSPKSNMVLYGETADIPGALAAGVNVALGPDWTPSGSRHILAEMKFANQINQTQWGGLITPVQLAQFVTCNAADAMGASDRIGQIGAGFQADLMVIPGDPADPYQALLEAEPSTVMLTVVSGRPMYGDRERIAQFPFLDMIEEIAVCGSPKALATQIFAYNIPDSDKPTALVVSDLQEAYNFTLPHLCEFLGPFACAVGAIEERPWQAAGELSIYPNPLRTGTSFTFSLPIAEAVCLRVYDVTGGVLRTLANRPFGPGEHTVTWDACDNRGQPAPSGIYAVRLESSGGLKRTGKLLVTR